MTSAWRSFGELWPIVAIGAVLVLGLIVVAVRGSSRTRVRVLHLLIGLWAALLAAVTLKPNAGWNDRSVDLIPFHDIIWTFNSVNGLDQVAAQVGGNVIMAAPIGILLRMRWGPHRGFGQSVAWSGLFFCIIEVLQFALPIGRATTIDDIILGITGCAIGWLGCHLIVVALLHYSDSGSNGSRKAAPVQP